MATNTDDDTSTINLGTSTNKNESFTLNEPMKNGGGGKKRSYVWEHFTEMKREDPNSRRRAACNYCGVSYACETKINGTTSMRNHLETQCKKYPFKKVDASQSILGFKPKQEGTSNNGALVSTQFSTDACKQALCEMIILDELPFKFVEGNGFKKFMFIVQPKWITIPSRVTVAKECYQIYLREKKKLKSAITDQRICLTTDTWTSLQNLNYMCLTAHFIDSDWNMQKRILNFCVVESHKGESLGKCVENCLLEWGIDKLLTVTVDNASSNNGLIKFLKRKTKNRLGTILEHEFLHLRCCAHILNLVVKDGLKDIDDSIAKVRNIVKYVKSSPQRSKTFMVCVEKEQIPSKLHVCLDVATRWNSTYLMLERAEQFQKAFERLQEDDLFIISNAKESEGVDDGDVDEENFGTSGAKKLNIGIPVHEDWVKVRIFVKFLKLFYDATVRFSGSNYVTSNSFVVELLTIQDAIEIECEEEDIYLKSMAIRMKRKFERYWGSFENMNILLYVVVVLDPRYKLRYLDFCLGTSLDKMTTNGMVKSVKSALIKLYNFYDNENGHGSAQEKNVNHVIEEKNTVEVNDLTSLRSLKMSQFKKHLLETENLESKSELEKYLGEDCEEDGQKFDILAW